MISTRDRSWLERPFSEEELVVVVRSCASDKARGSDDFLMTFFQQCGT